MCNQSEIALTPYDPHEQISCATHTRMQYGFLIFSRSPFILQRENIAEIFIYHFLILQISAYLDNQRDQRDLQMINPNFQLQDCLITPKLCLQGV